MINFHSLSERFFLKRKELSEAAVASITDQRHGFALHFL